MPYYKDVSDGKTRDGKRRSAEERGGFENEGTRYGTTRPRGAKRAPQGTAAGSSPNGRNASQEPQRGGERAGTRLAPEQRSSRPAQERGSYTGRTDRPAPEQRSSRPVQERGSYTGRTGRSAPEQRSSRPAQERGSYTGRTDRPAPERRGDRPAQERGGYTGRADRPVPERRGDRPAQERGGYTGRADQPAPEQRSDRPTRGYARNDARYEAQPSREGTRAPRRPGSMRFVQSGQQPYRGRGTGTAPRSYDEQRRDRRDEVAPRAYNEYRYEAPARPVYAAPVRPSRPVYAAPEADQEAIDAGENLLSGRNPIREALKSGRDIEKLLVARGELSGSAREIVAMAKEQHVPVQEVDRARLDAITPHHQGMLAFASAYQYHTVEEMLALAKERGEDPFLVILDGVTDPHNLGAIIRTAECAGAHGVIVQERRAVGLTPAAVKASAGAVEHIMVARVTNLVATLETLKRQNIWLYAADMAGEDYAAVDFSGGAALVVGAEGEGVSRLVLETCDRRVALPVRGKIDSLNASVAAGILLYAAMRSRRP